jgi:hypothetical protein
MRVALYESQRTPPRGIGVDWNNYDPRRTVLALEAIYSHIPGILAGVRSEAVEPLRFAAAMQYLWGESRRRWLQKDLATGTRFRADTASRMFMFYAQHQLTLHGSYGAGGYGPLRWVRIATCGVISRDECNAASKTVFPIEDAPELPHPACTHAMGCRCNYRIAATQKFLMDRANAHMPVSAQQ